MDEFLTRQIPHSVEAEQAVIGSILIDPVRVEDAISKLKSDDFYVPINKRIFETILSMNSNSISTDPVTLLENLGYRDDDERKTNSSYIMDIISLTPTSVNLSEYMSIVSDKSMLRNLIGISSEITSNAYQAQEKADDLVEIAEQKIYALKNGRDLSGMTRLGTVLRELLDEINELAMSDSLIPGLSTGFPDLDKAINGLNKSDLILVAARPGMGKTSFALNLALNGAKKNDKSVAVFQLEMSKTQLASRFLSNEAFIDSRKLKTGDLDDDDWAKIARASSTLANSKIFVDDNPAITVAEIKAKCRRLGEDLGLIVIDYLQLMQSGKKSDNRVNEVSEISRSLKIMAKELNVPVVCLSQLSRNVESREDKRPMLSDLRESGAIEQDADIVMFLYRDDYYNNESEHRNVAEVIVQKNRHGSTGTVYLQWIGEFTTFSSQSRRHD